MPSSAETIALDAMGGDHGASVVVPAALRALEEHDELNLILVGNQEVIGRELGRELRGELQGQHGGSPGTGGEAHPRLRIHHASQQVEMNEPPAQALRFKKDSSMRVAIDLVKNGDANACVSAGNTGALMATARFVLKTLPGVDRPAIIAALPTRNGHTHVLDLGASVDATPRHLFEFAVMGSVLASAVDNIERPRVALLNIGEEDIKGNERVRQAAALLSASALKGDLEYVGFAEGDDIYKGVANVIVCEGFVGNVALKSSEGVARMIAEFMKQEFTRTWYTRLAGALARPVLRALASRIDPRAYNGATFLGLRGIVIKSHGGADVVAFGRAISEALAEVRKNVPDRISEQLATRLLEREAV